MKNQSLLKLIAFALLLLLLGLAPLPRRAAQARIGSKKFTESVVLGEMLRLLAEESKLEVAHYREFGGTRIVFDALAAGEIDVYPEYTGTITSEIFAGRKIEGSTTLEDLLRAKGVGISKSLGFSNTYALALTRKRAGALGISRISDLKRLPALRFALTHEFLDRSDGWPALSRRYDLQQQDVVGVDHDVSYRQLLSGEIDVIDVYSTDAMIRRGDLVLLKDDLSFFPRYDAVWLYRLDLASRYPAMMEAIHRVEGVLSESTMQSLNDQVEGGGASESQAAADFLNSHGGLHVVTKTESAHPVDSAAPPGTPRPCASISPTSNRRWSGSRSPLSTTSCDWAFCPRVGWTAANDSFTRLAGFIAASGLALGYRSIGEGSITAVTALFCYCLLPIVRNTYTGLEGVPRGAIESATVLGLGPLPRLVQIELPIALPTILAGIRTSAVQNVGFATLGAIIGAGGLGQPILRGIRVNDLSLILAGAIPAALLALLLQTLIDIIEWAVTPRGLKRGAKVQE